MTSHVVVGVELRVLGGVRSGDATTRGACLGCLKLRARKRLVWTVASGRLVWERADAVSRGRRLIARSGLRVRLWRWARYGHGGLGEPEGAWGLAARFERGSGFRVVGGFLR